MALTGASFLTVSGSFGIDSRPGPWPPDPGQGRAGDRQAARPDGVDLAVDEAETGRAESRTAGGRRSRLDLDLVGQGRAGDQLAQVQAGDVDDALDRPLPSSGTSSGSIGDLALRGLEGGGLQVQGLGAQGTGWSGPTGSARWRRCCRWSGPGRAGWSAGPGCRRRSGPSAVDLAQRALEIQAGGRDRPWLVITSPAQLKLPVKAAGPRRRGRSRPGASGPAAAARPWRRPVSRRRCRPGPGRWPRRGAGSSPSGRPSRVEPFRPPVHWPRARSTWPTRRWSRSACLGGGLDDAAAGDLDLGDVEAAPAADEAGVHALEPGLGDIDQGLAVLDQRRGPPGPPLAVTRGWAVGQSVNFTSLIGGSPIRIAWAVIGVQRFSRTVSPPPASRARPARVPATPMNGGTSSAGHDDVAGQARGVGPPVGGLQGDLGQAAAAQGQHRPAVGRAVPRRDQGPPGALSTALAPPARSGPRGGAGTASSGRR
jgi:hypothetical protein